MSKHFLVHESGNSDTLGPELLECLLKMAPTKEEEDKLKELKDDADDESHSKLGPAEKFLKALLNIPFAFKRIDAMLYIVNFESETEYLKRSFDILEVKLYLSSISVFYFVRENRTFICI